MLTAVHAAIYAGDLCDGMAVVRRAGGHALDGPTFRTFVEHLVERHGPHIVPLVPALVEERRRGALVRMRVTVADTDDRVALRPPPPPPAPRAASPRQRAGRAPMRPVVGCGHDGGPVGCLPFGR